MNIIRGGGGAHGWRGGIFSVWRITRNGCMVNTLPPHVIHTCNYVFILISCEAYRNKELKYGFVVFIAEFQNIIHVTFKYDCLQIDSTYVAE